MKISILNRNRLLKILTDFHKLRIGVIGDFALDAYWYIDMTLSEISRETPLFIRPVIREVYSPGGAGNVASNIKALGVEEVYAITVFGKDWRGDLLKSNLEDQGIDLTYSISSPERFTVTYVKPILTGYDMQQEDSRIDFINPHRISETIEKKIAQNLTTSIKNLDVLIIADYLKQGIITTKINNLLNTLAKAYSKKTFLADSRNRIGLFQNMILKPNKVEAVKAIYPNKNLKNISVKNLETIGTKLQTIASQPIVITLGEEGALLFTGKDCLKINAIPLEPPVDPVGAGDTFLAALGASFGAQAIPEDAVLIATIAAAVTVKKVNTTGTASVDEIIAQYDKMK